MIKLSDRLSIIASFAVDGKKIIDVGTDHGYIPVYLAQLGNAERIAASDINPEPLARARQSAEEYGVEDEIEFILTDGLCGCDNNFDEIIMAGMGGDTMISVLENAPWTKKQVRLILQPQTKLKRLCVWLAENGYVTDDARLVKDNGKIYLVFSAHGCEESRRYSGMNEFIRRHLFENKDTLLPEYLHLLQKKYIRAIDGMKLAKEFSYEQFYEISNELREVQQMLSEVEKW